MLPMTQSVENWDGFVYQWQLKRRVTLGEGVPTHVHVLKTGSFTLAADVR